jgi:hypothetical protein
VAPFLRSPTWTWHFHGGPLDGLHIEIPEGVKAPAEIVWRDAHPPRELIYRKRPIGNVLTAKNLGSQEHDFDLA